MKNTGHYALMFILLGSQAFADMFSETEDKVSELNESLSGTIAVVIMTLAIIIAGFGLILQWFNKKTAAMIFAGGLVISSAASLAEWLIG